MVVAQALLEKGLLDGMTFGVEAATQTIKNGGWVWIALIIAAFFFYKRMRS